MRKANVCGTLPPFSIRGGCFQVEVKDREDRCNDGTYLSGGHHLELKNMDVYFLSNRRRTLEDEKRWKTLPILPMFRLKQD